MRASSSSIAQLPLLAALASLARAAVVPTAPWGGNVFNVGEKCDIEWDLDTTGTWTSFSITLMTGSNLAMVPVQSVATGLDGTKGATTLDYTCPDVTPNAAIYFYQFEQAGEPTSWTTRFTIAAADGTTTKPTQSTAGIAWGTGSLVGSSGSGAAAGSAAASSNASSPASSAASSASAVVSSAASASSSASADESSSSSDASLSATDNAASLVVTVTSTSSSSPASSASSRASSASASASAVSSNQDSAAGRVGAGAGVAAVVGAVAALIFA